MLAALLQRKEFITMFEVIVFTKDGGRKYFDHVISIEDSTENSICIKWKTDFDDVLSRLLPKDIIAEMKVRITN